MKKVVRNFVVFNSQNLNQKCNKFKTKEKKFELIKIIQKGG